MQTESEVEQKEEIVHHFAPATIVYDTKYEEKKVQPVEMVLQRPSDAPLYYNLNIHPQAVNPDSQAK